MQEFFSFMKVAVITLGVVVVLFIVLLSMPKSRLRGITLQVFGWGLNSFTGLCILYIVNPIDILPDVIPVQIRNPVLRHHIVHVSPVQGGPRSLFQKGDYS